MKERWALIILILSLSSCATTMDHGMRAFDRCAKHCKDNPTLSVKITGEIDLGIDCECGQNKESL